jgi:PKD repeat protein
VDFGASGTYTGTLEVTNCEGAGHDSYDVTVDVVCTPCEPAEIRSVTTQADGCSIAFDADVTGTLPIDYSWDFGAFGLSVEPEPVVDFGEIGTYPVTLTIENCNATATDVYTTTVDVTCRWMVYVPVVVKNY